LLQYHTKDDEMWDKTWEMARFLARFHTIWDIVRLVGLATLVGVLSGVAGAVFLVGLNIATSTFQQYSVLLLLLPLAGFGIAWAYHHYGGEAKRGTGLIIEELHTNNGRVPARMLPFILLGTWVTHLFGGSAGREGTAVQMSASLADALSFRFGIARDQRRLMLLAGIGAGFGAVFGTPVAGTIFALEVQYIGGMRYDGLLVAAIGAFVGDLTVRMLNVAHTHYPHLPEVSLDPLLLLKVAAAGVVFGLAARAFVWLMDTIKHQLGQHIAYPPYRALVGGVVVIGLTLLVGTTDYNGLGVPLAVAATQGQEVFAFAFLLKMVFTAVTLGSGFVGGEVTPLFVIGATLGASASKLLGVDQALLASVGFVAVFAAASNTPLACVLMGVELFRGGGVMYLLVGCLVAYLVSGHRGIYETQRVLQSKHRWYMTP
jgi:H+/Cl- antiporter ClcA